MASNPPTQPPSKGKGWGVSSADTNRGGCLKKKYHAQRRTFNSVPTIDQRADFLNIIQHNQLSQQVGPGLSTEDDPPEAHLLDDPDDTCHRDDMAGDVPANDEEHCEYDFSMYDDEDSTWANIGNQVEEDEIMDPEEQDVPDTEQDIVMTAPGNQRNSTKGKSTQQMVAEIKDQVSVLDELSCDQYAYANERYSMKIQAHMCDKEIAYLQVEKEAEHSEADQIHQCQLEQKMADLNLLDRKRDILSLKVRLAELGHLPTVNSFVGLSDLNFPSIPKHG
ncbi:hypothetical protein HD554DRAFT_2043087 [Boletus coccyginus]|nr:hypothetical protein HD554DRAFT_2043087 [Boletus coccyginus]